jgi:hypothetical protein
MTADFGALTVTIATKQLHLNDSKIYDNSLVRKISWLG